MLLYKYILNLKITSYYFFLMVYAKVFNREQKFYTYKLGDEKHKKSRN